jgi:hypothetical protein
LEQYSAFFCLHYHFKEVVHIVVMVALVELIYLVQRRDAQELDGHLQQETRLGQDDAINK